MPSGQTFQFTTVSPSLDKRRQRGMISPGLLSKAVGVDGRFSGSIRRFPGMRKLTTLSSPASNDYEAIYHCQAISLQKGNTASYLRGFAIYGYDGATYHTAIHYWTGSAWARSLIATIGNATSTVSFAERGKVLYCMVEGSSAQSVFWSGASISVETMGPGYFGTGATALAAPTVAEHNGTGFLNAGTYLVGYRYRDTDRGVYSGVSPLTEVTIAADKAIQVDTTAVEATSNIEDFDTVEVFRTISATFASSSYDGGILYKCGEATLASGGGNRTATYVCGYDTGGTAPTYFDSLRDEEVVQQTIVDPIAEYAASPPKTGVVSVYQGITFTGGTNGTTTSDARTRIQWSPLTSLNPENFPPVNAINVDNVAGEIIAMRTAGDALFAFSPNRVMRIQRAGGQLSFHNLHEGRGPVSKYAITPVDNSMLFVSQAQVLYMDSASGSITSVGALDRIVQDEWKDSLGDISCAYDPSLGAVIIHNSTEESTILIWASNNSITQLNDMTFSQCTHGVMPTVSGSGVNSLRSFFIDNTGRIYYPNAEADTTAYSATPVNLTTLGLDGTVRGACTVTGTTVSIPTIASNADAIGGYIYLSDGSTYERHTVTGNDTNEYTIGEALGTGFVPNYFELSPVPMSIRYWPVSYPRDRSDIQSAYPRYLFGRLRVTSMSVMTDENTLPSESEVQVGIYRNYSDTMTGPKRITVDDNPSDAVVRINLDGIILEPGLDLFVSGGIIEIVALKVELAWTGSDEAN